MLSHRLSGASIPVMIAAQTSTLSPLEHPLNRRVRGEVFQPLLDACGLGWFVSGAKAAVNTSPHSILRSAVALRHLPRESGSGAKVRAGGVRTVTEALFPGYLFARFRYPEQVRHVVSTTGVLGLVEFGGPPPRLDEGTIAHLRQHGIRRFRARFAGLRGRRLGAGGGGVLPRHRGSGQAGSRRPRPGVRSPQSPRPRG